MKTNLIVTAVGITILAASGYGLYQLGLQRGTAQHAAAPMAEEAGTSVAQVDPSAWSPAEREAATRRHMERGLKAGDVDPVTGRKVLYYEDPMAPGKRFDVPGKSPFMDMLLVPVYAGGERSDTGGVTVSGRIQQSLGLRTAEVVEDTLAPRLSAAGSIAWNERDQAVVQARAAGYVEKVHVRATFDRVKAGQPLVDLYVPEWVAAQEEFLALRRAQGTDIAALRDAARARMRQAGMSETQIARVESEGVVLPRLTLAAPIGGVVAEVAALEGMTVMPGATLFRIVGTSTVWAVAEVPESQAALARPGARVEARSPALPGATFEGRVQALLPDVSKETRTIKARLEIANKDGALAPGMFVDMRFTDPRAAKMVVVPSEAVIQTGQRALVMLAEGDGIFRPVEIDAGIESAGRTEVRRGLQPGQRVVVSAQFLLDSEASLRGSEIRLAAADTAKAPAAPVHKTEATIEAIKGDVVTLTHPDIPSLKWPGMTMDFKLPPAAQRPKDLAPGAKVEVEFRVVPRDAPQITSIRRAGAAGGGGTKP
jgi:Cu(I)/Ag(I) efflux system membrane fusion protein